MKNYRPEIDGLRAIAVLSVIFFHAGVKVFSGGYVGVDIFFVISGYLISTIIMYEVRDNIFSFKYFYERRARRILPALFVVMLCSLPLALYCLTPQEFFAFSQSLIAVSLFLSNLFFWKTSGYFDSASELKPLLHTWSLSVEEQFYIFFPLIILIGWQLGKRYLYLILIAISVLSFLFGKHYIQTQPMITFYFLPARVWEFLLGVSVTFLHNEINMEKVRLAYLEFFSFLGFILVICFIFCHKSSSSSTSSLYLNIIPTLGTALIIATGNKSTFVGKFLSSRYLVKIGLISYSSYLWHQPLFAFLRNYFNRPVSHLWMFSLIVVTLVLGYITWRYIERPFRSSDRFDRKSLLKLFFCMTPLFIATGYWGYITNGALSLKTNIYQRNLLSSAVKSPKRSACHTGGDQYKKPKDACEYFEGDLKVAVFGDSHAVELAYALADELRREKIKLKHFSFSGCAPMFERLDVEAIPFCTQWTNEAVDEIVTNTDINTVVVTYRINAALFGGHEEVYPNFPNNYSNNLAERDRRWSSYVNLLDKFVSSGKKVILVMQSPELPKPIEQLILDSSDQKMSVKGVTTEWWNERNHYVKSRLNQLPKEVIVIDPTDIFCDDSFCYGAQFGVSFYFDDDHLSIEGARKVAKILIHRGGIGGKS